jgi:hypothetical protein
MKEGRRKMNPLVVEREEAIQDVRIESTKTVRISRRKCEGNDYTLRPRVL